MGIKFSSATIEIFARLQPILKGHYSSTRSATIEIFARLQPANYFKDE